jgi:hypothetical protein
MTLVIHLLVLMALQCSQGLLKATVSLGYPCLLVGLPYCTHVYFCTPKYTLKYKHIHISQL